LSSPPSSLVPPTSTVQHHAYKRWPGGGVGGELGPHFQHFFLPGQGSLPSDTHPVWPMHNLATRMSCYLGTSFPSLLNPIASHAQNHPNEATPPRRANDRRFTDSNPRKQPTSVSQRGSTQWDGAVGKTSLSCATAIALAKQGRTRRPFRNRRSVCFAFSINLEKSKS